MSASRLNLRRRIHLYPLVDGDKWIQVDATCIQQHVSWCKRGLTYTANVHNREPTIAHK